MSVLFCQAIVHRLLAGRSSSATPSAVQSHSCFSWPTEPVDLQLQETDNIMATPGYGVNKSVEVAVPSRPNAETPMDSITGSLTRSLDQLESELGVLLRRIQPVIASAPADKSESRAMYSGNSAMSQFIANAINRINSFRDAVESANSNLEL